MFLLTLIHTHAVNIRTLSIKLNGLLRTSFFFFFEKRKRRFRHLLSFFYEFFFNLTNETHLVFSSSFLFFLSDDGRNKTVPTVP